jgi:hypothetical protein
MGVRYVGVPKVYISGGETHLEDGGSDEAESGSTSKYIDTIRTSPSMRRGTTK